MMHEGGKNKYPWGVSGKQGEGGGGKREGSDQKKFGEERGGVNVMCRGGFP